MENDLIHRSTALAILRDLKEAVGNYVPVDDIDDAIDMVKGVNAVDAEPVRHGRWIWGDDGYLRCSNCTQKAPTTTQYQDEPIQTATYYCPNCGAKMDAEVKHETFHTESS